MPFQTLLSALALTLSFPTASAAGTPYAATYWTHGRQNCFQDSKSDWIPDATCKHLPGKRLVVDDIALTFRSTYIFVYANEDCTGAEQ
ncbi:hypothetical protein EK21DRAFT_110421 [Setomelanomma holmii]|uniref:Uncharacterized protein n=1 Tax=Setomelanomma holmii TaxID=210430 RepID=A0A9P4HBL9_9PLEO|nr:hypothetical protein EK21DRAFT_110421 [Setomelanomma holmii]